MSWRTVYITQCERISLYLDSLLVIKEGIEYKIPLKDIGSIIVEDYKATFTLKILNKFVEYNILLITCDEQHNPYAVLKPIGNHSRQYKMVMNQMKWEELEKEILWQEIIKQKLRNQREILKILKRDKDVIEKMTRYIEEVEIGDRGNREGIGAGIYFRELFGDEFRRKVGESVCNSALNYGYTILTSKMSRVISGRGLLPYVGVHHRNEYNQFNLSCDLVEVFRPIVDYYIAEHLKVKDYFSREDRVQLINILNAKIKYLGKNEFVGNGMERFLDSVTNYFETGESIEGKLPSMECVELYEL